MQGREGVARAGSGGWWEPPCTKASAVCSCLTAHRCLATVDTAQKLKTAGFGQGEKLESSWGAALGREGDSVGTVAHVPRQS